MISGDIHWPSGKKARTGHVRREFDSRARNILFYPYKPYVVGHPSHFSLFRSVRCESRLGGQDRMSLLMCVVEPFDTRRVAGGAQRRHKGLGPWRPTPDERDM